MKLIVTCVVLFAVATFWDCADAEGCQRGFIAHGNSCYWFSPERVTGSWIEAQEYCRSMNSHLVIITSVDEDNFIREHLKRKAQNDRYWIGANDLQVGGELMWMSNGEATQLTYHNWNVGQPDHAVGEHCIELERGYNFKWNDDQCYEQSGFICEQN